MGSKGQERNGEGRGQAVCQPWTFLWGEGGWGVSTWFWPAVLSEEICAVHVSTFITHTVSTAHLSLQIHPG